MNIDGVIFDMDGVLLEGRGTPAGIYAAAVDSVLGAREVSQAEKRSLIAPETFDQYQQVCRKHGLDPETFWMEKENAASDREIDCIREGERELAPSALETLEQLDRRGVGLGIASNNSQAVVDYVAAHYGLDALIDVRYGNANTIEGFEKKKPDPHYIERAIDDLGLAVEAHEILYVGDKVSDVDAGAAAGTTPVLLSEDSDRLAEDPETLPGYRIRSLSELFEL